MSAPDHVATRTKLAFGVGASAEAAVSIAFNTFNFLFYNNVLGLSGTLTGLAVAIALVFDAISDPLVGSISDRWRSRLGRRHPFMYAATVPLGLCFYLIYSPPAALEGIPLFLWFTFFTILLRTFQTLYHVPHLALGAELTPDYRERTVVMSYNAIFGVVGGAGIYFLAWTYLGAAGRSEPSGYATLGAGVGVFAAVVIFASAFFTRDRIPHLSRPTTNLPRFGPVTLFREIGVCLGSHSYRMLLFGLVFLSAALGVRETINAYVSLYFWELPESQIRFFALATLPAYVIAFVATARLHARFDKRATLVWGICGAFLGAAGPICLRLVGFFPENGSPWLFPLLMGGVFTFYLSIAVLNISVMSALADVADEHELATGRRQEGIFYSARTLFSKLTSGLGHILAGLAIDFIGFPGKDAAVGEVAPEVIFRLGLLDGPIAGLPALIAIFFYGSYRIGKVRHREIRLALEARRAAVPSGGGN